MTEDRRFGIVDGLLVVLLISIAWFEGGSTPFGLFLNHTMIFLLVAGGLVRASREGRIVLRTGWECAAGLGLAVVCLLSFLQVDYQFGSFLSLWNVLMTVLFACVMILLGGSGWTWRASAVVVASVLQAMAALVLPGRANMTPAGTFANANQLAAYLGVGALIAIGLAVERLKAGRRILAAIALMAALLDIGVVIAIGARGALLSLMLVGALWAAGAARTLPRKSWPLLAGVFAVLALLSALSVASRFDRIFDPYRFDRVRIWQAGIEAAIDHPILGMGPGMFERRGYRYAFPLDRETFRYSKKAGSTHSTWLQVWVETGLTGFVAVALLLALIVPRLWRMRTGLLATGAAGAGAALALMACLIHGFVDTPFEVPAVTISLLALIVPMLRPARTDEAPLCLEVATGPGPSRRRAALALLAVGLPAWLGGVLLPYAADASFAAGAARSRPGSPDPAITRSIEINPFNPAYLAGRAQITWRRDRPLDPATFAAAHLDLDEARRLDPGRPEIVLMLAQLQARACFELTADPVSLDRAERTYREALSLGLKDPRPHLELALFLLARGDPPDEGIALIREALVLEPNYLGARLALVRVLETHQRAEEASRELVTLRELRRALSSYDPKNDYEADLMRLDGKVMAEMERRER